MLRLEKLAPLSDTRYALQLSDGRSLRCSARTCRRLSLCAGLELSEEALARLESACAYDEVWRRATELAAGRAMSAGELRRRLEDKGAAPEHAARAVERLLELGILDEAAYAAMVVRHYAAKGYGRRRVEQELYRHLVPRPLWEEALAELPEPEEKLDALIAAKLRGGVPSRDEKRKLTAALLRRGYDWSAIRAALRRCGGEAPEDTETE